MEIFSVKAIRMALFARGCSIWIAIIQDIYVLMRQRAFPGRFDVVPWLKKQRMASTAQSVAEQDVHRRARVGERSRARRDGVGNPANRG